MLIYLGFSLQLLQVGIIPLLPLIGKNLHIAPGATSWLVTASLLSGAICLAVLTRLADVIGKRRVVVICLVLVFAGSILGCVAQMPRGTGFGYGYSTLQVAWYAVPQALGSIACLVVIRRLVPRGHRASALAWGAGSIVLAFLVFGLLIRSPGATMAGLLLDSTGLGVTLAVSQIVIVRALTPAESGIALGLSIVLYAVGNTAGSAVVGVLFKSLTIGHTPLPSAAAFRWGFAISGVAAVLALGLCAALARRSDRVPAAHPVAT